MQGNIIIQQAQKQILSNLKIPQFIGLVLDQVQIVLKSYFQELIQKEKQQQNDKIENPVLIRFSNNITNNKKIDLNEYLQGFIDLITNSYKQIQNQQKNKDEKQTIAKENMLVFGKDPKMAQNYAFELKNFRNKWAHQQISESDTQLLLRLCDTTLLFFDQLDLNKQTDYYQMVETFKHSLQIYESQKYINNIVSSNIAENNNNNYDQENRQTLRECNQNIIEQTCQMIDSFTFSKKNQEQQQQFFMKNHKDDTRQMYENEGEYQQIVHDYHQQLYIEYEEGLEYI